MDAWIEGEARLLRGRLGLIITAQGCYRPNSPEYLKLVRAESHIKQAIEILEEPSDDDSKRD